MRGGARGLPRTFHDRRTCIEGVVAQARVQSARHAVPAHAACRECAGQQEACVAFGPPDVVRAAQEGDVVGVVHAREDRVVVVVRRFDGPTRTRDRGKDVIHA